MRRILTLTLVFLVQGSLLALAGFGQKGHQLLPQDLEIELALSGLPPHLRADATVYTLGEKGYTRAREGTNGFSCLVRQQGVTPVVFHNSFIVVCYDAEGSRTLLPAVFDQAELFAAGKNYEQVLAAIEEGWETGKYTLPGPGVSFMLSPIMHSVAVGSDAPGGYIPHMMFYAPNKTNEEMGATPPQPFGYAPWTPEPGKPWTMMVVPLSEMDRAAIAEAEQDLIAKMQKYLK